MRFDRAASALRSLPRLRGRVEVGAPNGELHPGTPTPNPSPQGEGERNVLPLPAS
jgi:hypothetical protein